MDGLDTTLLAHPTWSDRRIAAHALGPRYECEANVELQASEVALLRFILSGATPMRFPSHGSMLRFLYLAAEMAGLHARTDHFVRTEDRGHYFIDVAVFDWITTQSPLLAIECKNHAPRNKELERAVDQARNYGVILGTPAVLCFPGAERTRVRDVDIMSPTAAHLKIRRLARELVAA